MRWLVVLLCLLVEPAAAAYPEKPIRFVIPSAPGGSPDVLMRILLAEMSKQMGVSFVVENKPGASFVLGTMDIVRAPADGYTLGYGNIVSLAVNRSLLATVPYDVERDLTLISNCVRVYNMLAVNNNVPVRTKAMTGTFILHVPYRDSAQAINDLMGGQVQVMFDNVPSIGPHVKAGRVRGIAVSGPRRSPVFPEIPTVAEAGVPGYETIAWGGIIGPANLPKDIVARLLAEIRTAYASPAVQERYRNLDTEIDGGTPEQFLALTRAETPKWAAVVKRSGAKVD